MKKLSVFVPALALAVMMSASAFAENGAVSSTTLDAMGLGGMQVMSDQEAMAVRGRGFVSAYGDSSSSINIGINFGPFGGLNFDTSTSDGFLANGKYLAGGVHQSESVFSASVSDTKDISGVGTITRTLSLSIGIGSAGSASGFSL
jgi:hypothetical protein